MPRPSKYPEQFRRDAVELVRSGRTIRDVGRELGVNHETLRNWVDAAKRAEKASAGGGDEGRRSAAPQRPNPNAVGPGVIVPRARLTSAPAGRRRGR